MILLRYNAAKLLLAAGFLLFALIPVTLIFLYPEALEDSRRGFVRLFISGFGHDVVLPVLIGACLLLMWRCAATGLGRLVAIEAREDSIHVTDMWGTQRIAWVRLEPIQIERTSTGTSTSHRLIFRGGRRTAKVPVAMTDPAGGPIEALVARIETLRCGAGRREAPRAPELPAPAAARPTGFGRKRI
jgi:hypothetical protein